jgi:acetyltransferase-like isoleucine patch superfamily enzyme
VQEWARDAAARDRAGRNSYHGAATVRLRAAGRLLPRPLRARVFELPRQVGYYRGPVVASWLRRQWTLLRNPHATIEFGPHVYLGPGFSLHVPQGGTFVAERGAQFRRNFRAELGPDARVVVREGVVCTYDVLIQCSTEVEIGARTMIAQASLILDGNHRFRDIEVPPVAQGYDLHPVTIGEDAFIAAKCTVIADVGRRAVVGAHSVVTRPVPPWTVAVGAPARPVDYFGPPGEAPAELSQAARKPSASS